MEEATAACALVQRQYRVGRHRAEAHRGNVEHAGEVRLLHQAFADVDAEVMAGNLHRRQRMVDPLVLLGVEIHLGAERALVHIVLGTLVGNGTLGARERGLVGVGLDEILAYLGPDVFEEETQVRDDRIIATDRVPPLDIVEEPHQGERGESQARPQPETVTRLCGSKTDCRAEHADAPCPVTLRDEAVDRAQQGTVLVRGRMWPWRGLYGKQWGL